MRGDGLEFENAEQLVADKAPLDALSVEHGGMRGKARPDGRCGVFARPVHHAAKGVQYGSSFRTSARGSVPVTIRASTRCVPQLGNVAVAGGDDFRKKPQQAHAAVSA